MIALRKPGLALLAILPFLSGPATAAGDIKLSDFLFHPGVPATPSLMELKTNAPYTVRTGVVATRYPQSFLNIGLVGVVPDPTKVSFGSSRLSAQHVLLDLDTVGRHAATLLYYHHELPPPIQTSSMVHYGFPGLVQDTVDIKTMDPAAFGGNRLYVTEYYPQAPNTPAYGMIQVLGPLQDIQIGGQHIEFEWISRFDAPKAGESLQIRARPFTHQSATWDKHGTMCTEFEVIGGRDMNLEVIEFEGINVVVAGQQGPGKVHARVYDSASQALLWQGTHEIVLPPSATGTIAAPVYVRVEDMFGAPHTLTLEDGKKYRIGIFWDESVNGRFQVVRAREDQLPQIDLCGLVEMSGSYYSDSDTFPMSPAIEQNNVTPLVQRLVMMRLRVTTL